MDIHFIDADFTRLQRIRMRIKDVWKWLNANAGATALIVSIIGIVITLVK